ncbi:MAG: SemiSWEET transporter [Candidatus Gracilibacteria bacterium]|jgi:MtN3 and saliva related transmembrane protein|nr:SemiSWEET transporter [Candidatus Gracilibacteria bacterium]
MLELSFVFGCLATFLTIVAFMPQVFMVWKTRRTKDISLGTFLLLISGASAWLIYGIMVHDVMIVATNACLLVLQGIILFFKFKYG